MTVDEPSAAGADSLRTSRVAIEITTVLNTSCLRAGRVKEILNREYVDEIERLRKALAAFDACENKKVPA